MKKRLIPFDLTPASWGLNGKSYAIAKAEYELEGEELERELMRIMYDEQDDQFNKKLLELDLKYGRITKAEYDRTYINTLMPKDSKEQKLALLDLDHSERKITDIEYDKEMATINKTPWVTVVKLELEEGKPDFGSMELEWNNFFIDHLKKSGYEGKTEEQIVERWLGELCRNLALEQFSGSGDFDEQVNAE